MSSSSVICLMGPTASGKTALALDLARFFPIEIINVDSAQIYRGMDIGSGKPSLESRQQVVHHLMDILDPNEIYSAAQFREDALKIISDIISRGRIPLLVGGTFLYFKILQEGYSPLPHSDKDLRLHLTHRMQQEGLAALYQQLLRDDPISANRIQPTDPQRILRALEVLAITGKPMSFWLAQPKSIEQSYDFINIALIPLKTPRAVLKERIRIRFDEMLAQGLVAEVEALCQTYTLEASLPSLRSVGYRQVWHYLQNQMTYEAMREKAIIATCQLAKRQLTWLRQWPNVITFDFMAPDLLIQVRHFLQTTFR